jgi:hypothetical protein
MIDRGLDLSDSNRAVQNKINVRVLLLTDFLVSMN